MPVNVPGFLGKSSRAATGSFFVAVISGFSPRASFRAFFVMSISLLSRYMRSR